MKRVSLVVNKLFAYLGSIALALLMFLTIVDVVGRYLFNYPLPGTFELTEMLMVPIVFLALGLAQHHNEHISLDLAYNYFSGRLKKASNVLVDIVNLVVILAITWQLYEYFNRMLDGNYTTAVLQLPIHPFVLVALAGTASYVLALVSDFDRSAEESTM